MKTRPARFAQQLWTGGIKMDAIDKPALPPKPGLIILNAWYGKFVTDNSRKHERAKVIDVSVPLQCLVKDSKLILTEAAKVLEHIFEFISKVCRTVQKRMADFHKTLLRSMLLKLRQFTLPPIWSNVRTKDLF